MPLHLSFKNLYVTGRNDIITIGKWLTMLRNQLDFYSRKVVYIAPKYAHKID